MKKAIFTFIFFATVFFCSAQTGNFGIGTGTPSTKLDVNGALTTRQGTDVTVSSATVTMPNALTFTQYRLVGTPATEFTITGPSMASNGVTPLNYGARMVLVNTTTQPGILNGFRVFAGQAVEFFWSNTGSNGWISSKPVPEVLALGSAQQDTVLKGQIIGGTTILTNFTSIISTIFGANFDAATDRVVLPAGVYSFVVNIEMNSSSGEPCPAENFYRHSYFIDFPTGSDASPASIRVHSNTTSNCGNTSNHSALWSEVITITGNRTFTLRLGRGQSGNFSNGIPSTATGSVIVAASSRIIIQKLL